jgi:hypothetical protein
MKERKEKEKFSSGMEKRKDSLELEMVLYINLKESNDSWRQRFFSGEDGNYMYFTVFSEETLRKCKMRSGVPNLSGILNDKTAYVLLKLGVKSSLKDLETEVLNLFIYYYIIL